MKFRLVFPLTCLALALATPADACTRIIYHNGMSADSHEAVQNEAGYFTARSMDWYVDTKTDLWIFPKGIERNGGDIPDAIKWKSKYGSVVASAFNGATADGINEKGLVANFLYLNEADYGTRRTQQSELAVTAWAQYVLDNYGSVNEAVEALRKESFHIVSVKIPDGDHYATGHLSISDPSGDSAIFEYINGELIIHHDSKYTVMTNSPTFDKQLTINEYWQQDDGWKMLPGTSRSADRFVRADFYLKVAQASSDNDDASAATTLSILRNTSAPLNIKNPDPSKPNEASTIWRTVADQKNLRYYFDSALSPNVFWVDLDKVDLSATGAVKKLNLQPEKQEKDGHITEVRKVYAGEASDKFKQENKPFSWLVSNK